MKKLIFILCLFTCTIAFAQGLTKDEALNALKDNLNGQITHYDYGDPCSNTSSSQFRNASAIQLKNVKLDYDILQIEYGSDDEKYIKRLNMNDFFFIKNNVIYERKKQNVEQECEGATVALAFDKNSIASMEKSLKILNYLKKFITKSPFD